MSTRCYVNGKRVTKEELSKIEIRDEVINRILAEHLSRSPDNHKKSNTQSENRT